VEISVGANRTRVYRQYQEVCNPYGNIIGAYNIIRST
jgi:hypothetical protein